MKALMPLEGYSELAAVKNGAKAAIGAHSAGHVQMSFLSSGLNNRGLQSKHT